VFSFDSAKVSDENVAQSRDAEGHIVRVVEKKKSVEDYDLLHNILYYLYTDHITFGTNFGKVPSSGLPSIYPAEEIYTTAELMFLQPLKEKALRFLKDSCTVDNIISRLMSKFAEVHPEPAKIYEEFFRKNWDVIKVGDEYNGLFKNLKEESFDDAVRTIIRFRNLIKNAVFP